MSAHRSNGLCAIIADDLTGAADTAAPFARAGLTVRLTVGAEPRVDEGTQAIAVSTDSRAAPPEEAATRARHIAERLASEGADAFYKKIDSTLRGNVGPETLGVLGVLGADAIALVCPAFPPTGRTVVGGQLLVDGVPLARTGAARDPVTPVHSSAVAACFDGLATTTHIGVDRIAAGSDAVAASIAAADARVILADATTTADLSVLVHAADATDRPVLLTGSAGLVGPFADLRARAADASSHPALVVVGSLNDRSRTQVEHLRDDATVVELDASTIEAPDAWESAVRDARSSAPAVIVVVSPIERGDPGRVAARLGEVTVGAVADGVAGVVVTGGDIARSVLAVSGSDGIDVIDEVAPGVPLGRIAGGDLGGLAIVTKAGGFGDDHVLGHAAQVIRRRRGATT